MAVVLCKKVELLNITYARFYLSLNIDEKYEIFKFFLDLEIFLIIYKKKYLNIFHERNIDTPVLPKKNQTNQKKINRKNYKVISELVNKSNQMFREYNHKTKFARATFYNIFGRNATEMRPECPRNTTGITKICFRNSTSG